MNNQTIDLLWVTIESWSPGEIGGRRYSMACEAINARCTDNINDPYMFRMIPDPFNNDIELWQELMSQDKYDLLPSYIKELNTQETDRSDREKERLLDLLNTQLQPLLVDLMYDFDSLISPDLEHKLDRLNTAINEFNRELKDQ